jgi:glucose-1-phosphate cytidylyltransferase
MDKTSALKAVILAGGYGTRMGDEFSLSPKPMIEIGGRPILWHIMKIYSHWGIHDFIVCLGYKGYVIKEYFANYALHMADVVFDFYNDRMQVLGSAVEPWRITLIDTGEHTNTGGRLKRIQQYVGDGTFCMTYGDGVSDVNINALVAFHRNHGRLCTVTSVSPPGRFGVLDIKGEAVADIHEKPETLDTLINGGFFVLEPAALDVIDGDETSWEREPLQRLARDHQLMAYRHTGYWQPMDTPREKRLLEDLWQAGRAPWKVW